MTRHLEQFGVREPRSGTRRECRRPALRHHSPNRCVAWCCYTGSVPASPGLTAGRVVLRSLTKFYQGSIMSGPKDLVLRSARWVPGGEGWLLLNRLPPQAWLQDETQPSLICSGFDGLNSWLFGQLKVKSVKRVISLDCEPESTHDVASARLSGQTRQTTHLVGARTVLLPLN